ncbi:MAG: radical SAM protein [Bdellovibrionota bacterium]
MSKERILELRRYKDIVAFRSGVEAPTAFHAKNLEVAEISEELWNHLVPSNLRSSLPIEIGNSTENNEVLQAAEEWLKEENPEVKSGAVEFGIRNLTINVTQICNLHCTYCAAGGDGTYGDPVKKISIEKTLPQVKFFMEKLTEGQSFHISFLGGEPLLYPEAIQMIGEYAMEIGREKNIPVSFKVTTNGTIINEKVLAALKLIKCNIVISIDGPAEINDRVRPQKNKQPITGKITEGLQILLKNKEQLGSIGLHGVFDQNNMEIEKAYEFYLSLGVDWFEFTYAVNEHNDQLNQEYMKKMSLIANKAWNLGQEKELRKISNFNQNFKLLDAQQRVENHCGSGKSLLIVDARNRLYSCPWTVGQASEQMGDGTQLDMSKFAALKESLVEKNNCGTCWARFLCGGGCMFIHHGKTGNKHTKDPEFCERTRFLVSLSIMYYKRSREASQNNEV